MDRGALQFFRRWFADFCRSYHSTDPGEQLNITLKEMHSIRVSENALLIAKGEALGENGLLLAEAGGLFHDIGRFPQYFRYKTFRDGISVNHGELGAGTLKEQGVLDCLSENERDNIMWAVRHHNAFGVQTSEDAGKTLFLKIVRDADKLDIWRIFCEYYEGPDESKADAVPLGLPDLAEYSGEAVETILNKEVVKSGHVSSMNDFRLQQLSWVFDLNFRTSFSLAGDRAIISRLAAALPSADDIGRAVSVVKDHVREMAAHV
jgi:putative nucleotidyltransferase with HDIG domain